MAAIDDEGIKKRIRKDIGLFDSNLSTIRGLDSRMAQILELSKLYASDARSYLQKGDLYTSFACISYAHGLLDAVRSLNGDNIGETTRLQGGKSDD